VTLCSKEPHARGTDVELCDDLSDKGPGPHDHRFCRFTKFMRVQTHDGKSLRRSAQHPVVIYALVDPRDMTARYIGQTSRPVERVQSHWTSPANNELRQWRDDLSAAGMRFNLLPITVVSRRMAKWAEAYWIGFYRAQGHLYNIQAGVKKSEIEKMGEVPTAKRDAWGYNAE